MTWPGGDWPGRSLLSLASSADLIPPLIPGGEEIVPLALTSCPTSPPPGFIPMQIVSSAMGNQPPPAMVVKALAVAGMGS